MKKIKLKVEWKITIKISLVGGYIKEKLKEIPVVVKKLFFIQLI